MKKKQLSTKKKCDKLWGEIIRSKGQCEWCGRMDMRLEAAHIISRTYSKTRHDLKNGLCLCSACHRKGHSFPTLFTEFVIQHIGQDELDRLHRQAQQTDYKVDYYDVLAALKEIQ